MSEQKKLFQGDQAKIIEVDIDAPLKDVKFPYLEWYWSRYYSAVQKSQTDGDQNACMVYSFLIHVLNHQPNFGDYIQPYGSDLSNLAPSDISVLRVLANKTKDAALRSRLFDILWEQRVKDPNDGIEAATSYFTAAQRAGHSQENNFKHDFAATYLRRGLQVATKLGRDKGLFKAGLEQIKVEARTYANGVDKGECWRHLDLLSEFKTDEPIEFAVMAENIAQEAKSHRNFYGILKYWQLAGEFYGLAKDKLKMQAAKLEEAEAYVIYAEDQGHGPAANFLAAAGNLTQGIEALRRAGASPERIKELRSRLSEYQRKSQDHFSQSHIPFDAAESIAASRMHVKNPDLRKAILNFAFGALLSDPKLLQKRVMDSAKQHKFSSLFGAAFHDENGRLIAQRGAILPLQGEAEKEAVQAEMFSRVARIDWPFREQAYIEPARQQILSDHNPSLQDLTFLVYNNPFIPPGHEGIFLRGIHAGFHGDFLLASHLLVPQIENSVRYFLASNGVIVTIVHPNGLEDVKLWGDKGGLLGMTELEQIFGEDLVFELRGHLVEKTAYNFRNRIAHGMATESECFSTQAISIWWLIIRICVAPGYLTIVKTNKKKSKSLKTISPKKRKESKRG